VRRRAPHRMAQSSILCVSGLGWAGLSPRFDDRPGAWESKWQLPHMKPEVEGRPWNYALGTDTTSIGS
jgi:hypothetical protein